MEQLISKEELDEIMKIEGDTRGDGIKAYMEFVLNKEGEEGLNSLEKHLSDLGYPIKQKEIKRMDVYPVKIWVLILTLIEKLFNFKDKDFYDMGEFQVKTSMIIRIFMRYFFSIEKAAKELPKIWKQYFTIGQFNTIEFNEKEKYLILRLEDFKVHPAGCKIILGVLLAAVQMIVKSGNVSCEQTKCQYKNNEYHEYLIKW